MFTHPRTPLFLTPPHWTNDERGNAFERFTADLLALLGWSCKTRLRVTGMEIDVLAQSSLTREQALVQCKFQRDPLSANVIDLLLGQAMRRKAVTHAFLFSLSQLGKEAKGVLEELQAEPAPKHFAFHGPDGILELLARSNEKLPQQIYRAPPGRSVAGSHLLLHPDFARMWLHEEHVNGMPVRVVVEGSDGVDVDAVTSAVQAAGLFEDVPFEAASTATARRQAASRSEADHQDTVAPVPVADSIDDYRPCRPADFIGRQELLRVLRSFLDSGRKDETGSRVLALTGHSGFGKSSLVLKLAEQCNGRDLRTKLFMFAVDTRSARHKSFVSAAVYECLQAAVRRGFLPDPPEPISIPSEGSILGCASMAWALDLLWRQQRAIVRFFDQFEEVLSKDELRPAFDALHALALEVHAESGPIILGFSWRLGITLSEDNPAYHLWHGLADLRRTFEVGPFSEPETNSLITQFERTNNVPLLIPVRKRIRDQSLGLPWLTKKLSIHLYKQIKAGAAQIDLLSQKLNVVTLFQEDLADLSPSQIECLKSIASQSPVDLTIVADEFSQETVNSLLGRRLILRTGGRLAPYWDIFRDFLRDGRVPAIEWQWLPIVSPSMAIPTLMQLQASGRITLADLAARTGYSEGTVQNILSDLQNVALVRRDETDGA